MRARTRVARGARRHTGHVVFFLAPAAPAGSPASEPGPSAAHRLSREVVIDPVYSVDTVSPEPDARADGPPWLYGYGELETWQHQRLRRRVDRSLLHVNYPGVFHEPFAKASFRVRAVQGALSPLQGSTSSTKGTSLAEGSPYSKYFHTCSR